MKKGIAILLLIVLTCIGAKAQWSVGMRDNRYIFGSYTLKNHYTFKLEQSLISEKVGFQYIRAYVGYKGELSNFKYDANVFGGTAWNRTYQTLGARVHGRYVIAKRIIADASLMPYYETGYKYTTCYGIAAGVILTKNIDILAGYTNEPVYRKAERYAYGAFDFHVGNLSVKPTLAYLNEGAISGKCLRATISFDYTF